MLLDNIQSSQGINSVHYYMEEAKIFAAVV